MKKIEEGKKEKGVEEKVTQNPEKGTKLKESREQEATAKKSEE